MPVSDRDRHDVFLALQASLGGHAAEVVMAMLPPSGWDDVATKTDLLELKLEIKGDLNRIDARIDRLDTKLDGVEHRLDTRIDRLDVKVDRLAVDVERVDAKIAGLLPRFLLTQLGVIVTVVGLVWMISRGAV